MFFKDRIAIRVMLWISVIGIGQTPLICVAQTAARNAVQIHKLDQELSVIERNIDVLQKNLASENGPNLGARVSALEKMGAAAQGISDEQRAYLKDIDALKNRFEGIRKDLDQLADKMSQTAERVSGKEMDINNSYFSMLSLVMILASIAVAVVGAFAFFILENLVAKRIADSVEKEIKVRAFYETTLGRADTFALLAFAWYEHYAKAFQRSLQSQTAPTVLEDSGLARSFSERGMTTLNEPEFVARNKGDLRAWSTRATLANLLVYNTTAHLLCQRAAGGIPNEDEEISSLLGSAETCLALANDQHAQERHWYDLSHTAAFAMIKIGDQRAQRRGRAVMLRLLDGNTPGGRFTAPNLEWRQELWDDCFSTSAGPSDLLGLGRVPARPT